MDDIKSRLTGETPKIVSKEDVEMADICGISLDELEQEPRLTIDEWDDKGPCVTVQYNGREYVGTLEEWNTIQRNR